jgi:hypothetical protein
MPRVQNKRGTAANLASVNPTPLAGELVWESDTNRLKVGSGSTAYTSLAYVGTNSPTFTGQVTLASGSVEAPSLLFSGTDTDTGLYWVQENTLAISCGGIQRLRISGLGLFVNATALVFGTSTSRSAGPTVHPSFQFEGTTAGSTAYQCIAGSTTASVAPQILMARHRGAVGDSTLVENGDTLGVVRWSGGDGTDCRTPAAQIECRVDGEPGENDMPGRLMFFTTADGNQNATERMRITSAGLVGIATTAPTATLDVNANTLRLRTARTPASAGATGNAGDICWDSSYLYVCTATNTWRRIAHSTW